MLQFLWGALAMATLTASLIFLKSWRETRDRLFAMFAAAFAVLSVNWIVLGIVNPGNESRHYAYLIRLVAFVLILIGIVDKNRKRGA